jgi:hypothetical protein
MESILFRHIISLFEELINILGTITDATTILTTVTLLVVTLHYHTSAVMSPHPPSLFTTNLAPITFAACHLYNYLTFKKILEINVLNFERENRRI